MAAQGVPPALAFPGITQWLGGLLIKPEEPLHLAPGLYPYLVRVEPAFYKAVKEGVNPLVAAARAAGQGAAAGAGDAAEKPPDPARPSAVPGARPKPEGQEFRIAPAFRELPHPPTCERLWLERVRSRAARLEAVLARPAGDPGGEEGRRPAGGTQETLIRWRELGPLSRRVAEPAAEAAG